MGISVGHQANREARVVPVSATCIVNITEAIAVTVCRNKCRIIGIDGAIILSPPRTIPLQAVSRYRIHYADIKASCPVWGGIRYALMAAACPVAWNKSRFCKSKTGSYPLTSLVGEATVTG